MFSIFFLLQGRNDGVKSYLNDDILGTFTAAEIMESVFERVENIVGKGENGGFQHFLLFPPMFSNIFLLQGRNDGVKIYLNDDILGTFTAAEIIESVFERVENIVGKGENAGFQHFLLFPPMFSNIFLLQGRNHGVKS